MPIVPYDRAHLPSGVDNSAFGRQCKVISLFDLSAPRSFTRSVTRHPDFAMPATTVFNADGPMVDVPFHMRPCTARFTHAVSALCEAWLFMPDHATLVRDGGENAIVSESLWHNELFFAQPFRNDASTGWQWRVDEAWSHTISYDEVVNHCYHRFYFQYFHWMMDCLPRAWMLRKYAPHRANAKWLAGPLDKPFHSPSLELLGIKPEDCLHVPYGSVAHFEKLVVPGFAFEEPLKTLRPSYDSGLHHIGWSHEYLDDIRRLAWDRYASTAEPDLRLYVGRGDAAHRRLRNEADVLDVLRAHGFTVVEPGNLSFAEQVRLFSRAIVVVGLHGAGLTNLMWARPSCEVLELGSEALPDTGYRFLSNLCGHNHSLLLCHTFAHQQGAAYADLAVDMAAFGRALEHALSAGSDRPGLVTLDLSASPPSVDANAESRVSLDPATKSLTARNYPQALREALSFCDAQPGNGWGWLTLGRVYRGMGDLPAMRSALQRALSLPDPNPQIGAAYDLLETTIAVADFRDRDLIDFAILQAESSEQKRWYYATLLFQKALTLLHDGALVEANHMLGRAYGYRVDTDEQPFLYPWVVARLAGSGSLASLPYLDYLSRRAAMAGDHIDYQAALDSLGDSATAIEIGAMDGVRFDTLHGSLTTRNWHAILVEPTRGMFEQLVENYAAFPNVRCVRVAISDRSGSIQMHRIDPEAVATGKVGDWALGLSSVSADKSLKFYDQHLETEEVEALTLPDFLAREQIERIDVLQVDTEGHDFIIFNQIDFARFPIKLLHIELINLDPVDRLRMFDTLAAHGYRYHYDGVDLTALRPD